jgi:hypothetical protein
METTTVVIDRVHPHAKESIPELDIVLEFAEGMCYPHFSVSGTE